MTCHKSAMGVLRPNDVVATSRDLSVEMTHKARQISGLRHTMATNYIRKGGDAVRLQRILGHGSITTTMKYVHLQTEDL